MTDKDILYNRSEQRVMAELGDVPICPKCSESLKTIRVLYDYEAVSYNHKDYNIISRTWVSQFEQDEVILGKIKELLFRCIHCRWIFREEGQHRDLYIKLVRLTGLSDVVNTINL